MSWVTRVTAPMASTLGGTLLILWHLGFHSVLAVRARVWTNPGASPRVGDRGVWRCATDSRHVGRATVDRAFRASPRGLIAIIPLLDPIRQPDDAAAEPVANVSTGEGRALAMSGSPTGGEYGGRRGFTSRHPRHRLDDGVSVLEQLRPDLRADPGPLGRSDVAVFRAPAHC